MRLEKFAIHDDSITPPVSSPSDSPEALPPIHGVFRVEAATLEEAEAAMQLVRGEKTVFPFLPRSVYEKAAMAGELWICRKDSELAGCLHFHHRKDGGTTVHEILVVPSQRGRGAGRHMLDALEAAARERGQKRLRLKCPIDQPANGFYARVGFSRVGVEAGARRHVAVWERALSSKAPMKPGWEFYASMTSSASDIRQLIRRYHKGHAALGRQPKLNPFGSIIFTPLFSSGATLNLFRELASDAPDPAKTGIPYALPRPKIMFDCGGYQVQMGRMDYEALCSRLRALYQQEQWADHYVLPDHVPLSSDSDDAAEKKADDTLLAGRNFLSWLPECRDRFVGVVHGRTPSRIAQRARNWQEMGVNYLAFGSFGTSGPNGSVNLVSHRSIELLSALTEATKETGQRIHIFGVGGPAQLDRFWVSEQAISSYDSSNWWKMAGYGYVLGLDRTYRVSQTHRQQNTIKEVRASYALANHECPFCADLEYLRNHRWFRILHNLNIFMEGACRYDAKLKDRPTGYAL